MYSVIFHAHQKIDKVAYRHLTQLDSVRDFPNLEAILHFEGRNGPDAVKFKNKDTTKAPWHFVDPFDAEDTTLAIIIQDHYDTLVEALKEKNHVRAAFDAAWLAHALVDGLTPAHHYPYEKELEELRGEGRESRTTLRSHVIVKNDQGHTSLKRSMKLVGPKGLLTAHTMFEAGAFSIIAPLRLTKALPSPEELETVQSMGVVAYFQRLSREVAALNIYERFCANGWTPRLARSIRKDLGPAMAKMVTLAWYSAVIDAGLSTKA